MKIVVSMAILWLISSLSMMGTAAAEPQAVNTEVLFTDVNIFDGKNNRLHTGQHVLVSGNKITKISDVPVSVGEGAVVVDGSGRTLMPGLIDAHSHIAVNASPTEMESSMDLADAVIRMTLKANNYLMDGFTAIRDMGGHAAPIHRAIEAGLVPGPRVYSSEAFISQTSGHGDLRHYGDPNPTLSGVDVTNLARMGVTHVVDGRARVLAAVRQSLMQGATQIKIMAGGGGASKYDPIDTTQFTEDEIRAAVQAAEDWGTYVTAHIFTSKAIQRAVNAGVKGLEHGFFMDEETVKLVAKRGVYVMPQMWGMSPELFKNPYVTKSKHGAIREMQKNAPNFVKWLMKHKVKVVFGTDDVGDMVIGQNSRRYELFYRAEVFGNFETLKQATSVAGELLALTGLRNPYEGKQGVVEEGALADLLLVDGNPLEDISVLGAQSEWFSAPPPEPIETLRVIMKDGVVYKNTL